MKLIPKMAFSPRDVYLVCMEEKSERHNLTFHPDHWALLKHEASIRKMSVSRLIMMCFQQWRTSYVSLPPRTQSRLISQAKIRYDGAIDTLINRSLDALEKCEPIKNDIKRICE